MAYKSFRNQKFSEIDDNVNDVKGSKNDNKNMSAFYTSSKGDLKRSHSSDEEDDVTTKKLRQEQKDIQSINTNTNSSDIAQKLMQKMGYKEGRGLGKNEQGNIEVIPQSKQKGRRGLGFELKDIQVDEKYEWSVEKEEEFIKVQEPVEWMPTCEQDLEESGEELITWFKEGPKKLKIEDEDNFCDPEIVRGVCLCKSVFDRLSGEELRRARSMSNPFETIEKGIFQNRAAMKMANIDTIFNYMFTEPKSSNGQPMVTSDQLLYFADICAGPGGFSEYVLWKKGWHAKGFGFTLKSANDFKLEDFLAGSPETFEPHYGEHGLNGDGDIYKPKNLIAFRDFVLQNTEGQGCHFVMGDGGFSVEGQENIQEILSKRLYLCQFLCALAILRTEGSFVCKLFDIFTPFSVGLIYLMYRVFGRICIFKPNTSRPANSERYIVCQWKRPHTDPVEEYLFKLNCHLDYLTNHNSKDDIYEVVPFEFITQDVPFFQYIYDSNTNFGKRQILYLSKVKTFAENSSLVDTRQLQLKKDCLKFWNIPLKARVAPQRSDANQKFKDLTKNNFGFYGLKPDLLVSENLKQFEFPYGYKCVVLGSDPESTVTATPIMYGFFLGLGRRNLYFWNGTAPCKWIKVDVRVLVLELPPSTLFYGECIHELKGEGKAQRRNPALHIIDALFLGGKDVRGETYDNRMSMARKLVKAVSKPTQVEFATLRVKQIYELVNIHQVFEQMDMKECKSGTDKIKLGYEIEMQKDRFFIPSGLLFFNTTRKPWIVQLSKSSGKLYYFNTKDRTSKFDCPHEALADFETTFSNRLFWKFESNVNLLDDTIPQIAMNKVHKFTLLNFIKKCNG